MGERWEVNILDFITNESPRNNTQGNKGNRMRPETILELLRITLPVVDPAALTGADRRALLTLVQSSMKAAGIE